MFNKSKVSLMALSTLFSVSAIAEDHHHSFYVEFELEINVEDTIPAPAVRVYGEFCNLNAAEIESSHCNTTQLDVNKFTLVHSKYSKVFLKSLRIIGVQGAEQDEHHLGNHITLKHPLEGCTLDLTNHINSSQDDKGYPLLEVLYEIDEPGKELECLNAAAFWPTERN